MENKEYNWWADPKNKHIIDYISWWKDPKNKITFPLPISIVYDDNGVWIAATNDETEALLGDKVGSVAQGETQEEAIKDLITHIKIQIEYYYDMSLSYERWVPLRIGPWSSIGGSWFTVFGFNFYFRYGKNMKHGWYIPFTKLNISIRNQWKIYREYRKSKKLGK
jgi:hypothetical protein